MRRIALVLTLAAGAVGCGVRDTSDRARLWTLFDFARLAEVDGSVTADGLKIPATYFVKKVLDASGAPTGHYELAASSGFVDGQPMTYVTTELWAYFDKVWVQPLYIGLPADGSWDDPNVAEPWVFGIGPKSLFYSPFWQVYRFQIPPGGDIMTLLDARAVLEAANQTGGLIRAERRISSLAPASVFPSQDWSDTNNYHDDTAAWDGVGGRRYVDVGPGRFDFDDDGVVAEFPIFIFTKRGETGEYEPMGWQTVGGTRPLFAAPPSVTSARDGGATDDGGAAPPLPPVNLIPNFGGLWRMYTVDLPDDAAPAADGRVVLNRQCLDGSAPCVVLDSQTAIESLGAARIHRTELLATCPILRIGNLTLPQPPANQPLPRPTTTP